MIEMKQKPFYLKEKDIAWVDKTLAGLSLEEKVGQLFVVCLRDGSEEELDDVSMVLKPGGVIYGVFSAEAAVGCTNLLRDKSKVPMLIAADLEKGGSGIVQEGTILGSPMEVAATCDVEMAGKLGRLCGREGLAAGANWAFAPIIDIDYNFRNPNTNVRTFGSDVNRVKNMGEAYVKAVQECGMAACIKHFPGDGRDERDQHFVSSVNDLTCEEWDKTYGAVYRACIDAGAMTVTVGHILQPEYAKKLNTSLKDEEILPASLSHELMQLLLRDKLGFNGVITTDATTMAGYTIPMKRSLAVPTSIAAGADIFLFSKNLKEDYKFMWEGVKKGIISPERLDEAVARILALKAALGLHKIKSDVSLEEAKTIIGCREHVKWAGECADKAITLVKEEKGVLPLSVEKIKRILYYSIESGPSFDYSVKAGVSAAFREILIKEGFEVTEFKPSEEREERTADVTEEYDLIIYFANINTKSNRTTVRIEWAQPMGANCPHYIASVPTIFISVENPYHLLDVPRIRTFINCYNSNDEVLAALIDKLMGRSSFKGISPVDVFCGRWDTKLQ